MVLPELAILLAAAVLAVPLFKRLGLGSVLGYLAAGALIGPSALGLVTDVEDKQHIAEFGVVLLLFLIGLELSPSRLWKMRGSVFGLGAAQMLGSGAVLAAGAAALSLPLGSAIVVGLALSLSSTAFVLQILGERSELATQHGRSAFGILLFQDLAAIPLLAIVPALGTGGHSEGHPLQKAALAAGAFVMMIVAGRFLMRPLFRLVASARSHELSTAFALLLVVSTSLLMEEVGLSMALGAFLAGVLLAESEYRHELEANIEPFKGLLLGLFFVSVGMGAKLEIVAQRPLTIVGVVVGLTVVKLAVLYAIARATRHTRLGAASLAIALSQGGEFAFVVFGVARASAVIPADVADLLVVAVSLSMILTPLLFLARDRLRAWRARHGAQRPFDAIDDNDAQVIIAGFGRFGQMVARLLRSKRIPFTALDASATHVDFVRRFGNKIYYGDASRLDLLRAAHADKARLFVLAIDDPEASVRTAKMVREQFPGLKIIARARNRPHAYALMALEIPHIVRETFHSSMVAARWALEELGLTASEAREAARKFQEHDERQLEEQFKLRDDEQALIASARKAAADLEKLFEGDAQARS